MGPQSWVSGDLWEELDGQCWPHSWLAGAKSAFSPAFALWHVAFAPCRCTFGQKQCTPKRFPKKGFAFAWLAGCPDVSVRLYSCSGGRDTDSTTRGLGGTAECPTTSCGEENLLMEDDEWVGAGAGSVQGKGLGLTRL